MSITEQLLEIFCTTWLVSFFTYFNNKHSFNPQSVFMFVTIPAMDSSVGIATRYGLGGPGIESRWWRDFPRTSRPSLGPIQPPIRWVPSVFPGSHAAGAWRWPSTTSRVEIKERVELYFYCPSGHSWSALGWTLLYFTIPGIRISLKGIDVSALSSRSSKFSCEMEDKMSLCEVCWWMMRNAVTVGGWNYEEWIGRKMSLF